MPRPATYDYAHANAIPYKGNRNRLLGDDDTNRSSSDEQHEPPGRTGKTRRTIPRYFLGRKTGIASIAERAKIARDSLGANRKMGTTTIVEDSR